MDSLGIADDVVIRHVCRCEGATEHPRDDEATEHVFQVDGEDFPWLISTRGPLVTRLRDDLYTVDVEILALTKHITDKGYRELLSFEYENHGGNSVPYRPIIGGRRFPWTCSEDEMTLTFCHKMLPTLHLKFLALNVDVKGIEVDDQREVWSDRAIWRAGGDLIREGKMHCYDCDQWVDELIDHYQEKHPYEHGVRVS